MGKIYLNAEDLKKFKDIQEKFDKSKDLDNPEPRPGYLAFAMATDEKYRNAFLIASAMVKKADKKSSLDLTKDQHLRILNLALKSEKEEDYFKKARGEECKIYLEAKILKAHIPKGNEEVNGFLKFVLGLIPYKANGGVGYAVDKANEAFFDPLLSGTDKLTAEHLKNINPKCFDQGFILEYLFAHQFDDTARDYILGQALFGENKLSNELKKQMRNEQEQKDRSQTDEASDYHVQAEFIDQMAERLVDKLKDCQDPVINSYLQDYHENTKNLPKTNESIEKKLKAYNDLKEAVLNYAKKQESIKAAVKLAEQFGNFLDEVAKLSSKKNIKKISGGLQAFAKAFNGMHKFSSAIDALQKIKNFSIADAACLANVGNIFSGAGAVLSAISLMEGLFGDANEDGMGEMLTVIHEILLDMWSDIRNCFEHTWAMLEKISEQIYQSEKNNQKRFIKTLDLIREYGERLTSKISLVKSQIGDFKAEVLSGLNYLINQDAKNVIEKLNKTAPEKLLSNHFIDYEITLAQWLKDASCLESRSRYFRYQHGLIENGDTVNLIRGLVSATASENFKKFDIPLGLYASHAEQVCRGIVTGQEVQKLINPQDWYSILRVYISLINSSLSKGIFPIENKAAYQACMTEVKNKAVEVVSFLDNVFNGEILWKALLKNMISSFTDMKEELAYLLEEQRKQLNDEHKELDSNSICLKLEETVGESVERLKHPDELDKIYNYVFSKIKKIHKGFGNLLEEKVDFQEKFKVPQLADFKNSIKDPLVLFAYLYEYFGIKVEDANEKVQYYSGFKTCPLIKAMYVFDKSKMACIVVVINHKDYRILVEHPSQRYIRENTYNNINSTPNFFNALIKAGHEKIDIENYLEEKLKEKRERFAAEAKNKIKALYDNYTLARLRLLAFMKLVCPSYHISVESVLTYTKIEEKLNEIYKDGTAKSIQELLALFEPEIMLKDFMPDDFLREENVSVTDEHLESELSEWLMSVDLKQNPLWMQMSEVITLFDKLLEDVERTQKKSDDSSDKTNSNQYSEELEKINKTLLDRMDKIEDKLKTNEEMLKILVNTFNNIISMMNPANAKTSSTPGFFK